MLSWVIWVGVAVLGVAPSVAWPQDLSTAGRLSDEAARQASERERLQQERLLAFERARLPTAPPPPDARLPEEMPCQRIDRVMWKGTPPAWTGGLTRSLSGAEGDDDPLGRCLGAAGVGVLVARAQGALLAEGWITSRVLVEPQDLSSGVLTLTVLPGRVTGVRAGPQTPSLPARTALWPMADSEPLNLRDLEQGLEQLQRLPSWRPTLRLEPGSEPGTTEVVVDAAVARPWRGHASLDDGGSRHTGRWQGSLSLAADNPLGIADVWLASLQRDLGGGDPGERGTGGHSLSVSVPWGHDRISLSHARHRYRQAVAGATQTYLYRGESATDALRWTRTVRRDGQGSTQLGAEVFARSQRNFIDDVEITVQRRRTAGWALLLDHQQRWGRADLQLSAAHRRGTGAFGAIPAPEEAFGEGTARLRLTTLEIDLRLPLAPAVHQDNPPTGQRLRYRSTGRLQWHHAPLTPSDRFSLGGRSTVRGFDGEVSLAGDSGWLWRQELAWDLPSPGWQTFMALDVGGVSGPSSRGLAGRHLAGAAVGLRAAHGPWQAEVFMGLPLHQPAGFAAPSPVAGLSLYATF